MSGNDEPPYGSARIETVHVPASLQIGLADQRDPSSLSGPKVAPRSWIMAIGRRQVPASRTRPGGSFSPRHSKRSVFRLVVPVVEEHREKAQRVHLRARGATRGGLNLVQFVPGPSAFPARLDTAALQRPLDYGGFELLVLRVVEARKTLSNGDTLVHALQPRKRVDRAAITAHAIDDVHAIRRDAERREQPCRQDFGVDLGVVGSSLTLTFSPFASSQSNFGVLPATPPA